MERAPAKLTASGAPAWPPPAGQPGTGPKDRAGTAVLEPRVAGGRATVNERSVPDAGDRDRAAHPVDGGRASGGPSGAPGGRGARGAGGFWGAWGGGGGRGRSRGRG